MSADFSVDIKTEDVKDFLNYYTMYGEISDKDLQMISDTYGWDIDKASFNMGVAVGLHIALGKKILAFLFVR